MTRFEGLELHFNAWESRRKKSSEELFWKNQLNKSNMTTTTEVKGYVITWNGLPGQHRAFDTLSQAKDWLDQHVEAERVVFGKTLALIFSEISVFEFFWTGDKFKLNQIPVSVLMDIYK